MTSPEVRYSTMEEKRQEISGLGLENIELDEKPDLDKDLSWKEWLNKWNEKAHLAGVPEFVISVSHASNLFTNIGYMTQEYQNLTKCAKKLKKATHLFEQTSKAIASITSDITALNKQYAQIQMEERDFEENQVYSLFDFLFTMQIDEYEIGFYCTPKAIKKYAQEKKKIQDSLRTLHEEEWKLTQQQQVHKQELDQNEAFLCKGKKQLNKYVLWTSFFNLIQIGVDYWELQSKLKQLDDGSNLLRKTKRELEILWSQQIVPCFKKLKRGEQINPKLIPRIEGKLEGLKCRCEEYAKISTRIRNGAIGSSIKHGVGVVSSLGTLYKTHDQLGNVSKFLLSLTSLGSSYLAVSNAKLAVNAHRQKKAWEELKKEIVWVQEQLEKVSKKIEQEEEKLFQF